jgi:hypothetical protein
MRFLLLVLLLALGSASAQSSVSFEKGISKSAAAPGEAVKVVLTVTNSGKEAITDLTIRDSVSLPGFSYNYVEYLSYLGPGESRSFSYTILAPEEGNYTLPSAVLEFTSGGRRVVLRSGEVVLHVTAAPPAGGGQNFTGDVANKSAETRLYTEPEKGLTVKQALKFSLLGLIGMLPIAYLVVRHFRKRGKEIAKIYREKRIEAPPRDVLGEAKQTFYAGNRREAFEQVSSELRRLLRRRYGRGGSMTLREGVALLSGDERLSQEVRSLAREAAELCELVEFANYDPSPEEFHLALKGLSKLKSALEKEGR